MKANASSSVEPQRPARRRRANAALANRPSQQGPRRSARWRVWGVRWRVWGPIVVRAAAIGVALLGLAGIGSVVGRGPQPSAPAVSRAGLDLGDLSTPALALVGAARNTSALSASENAGSENAGSENAGSANAGSANAGSANAGSANAGSENAGSANAGSANAGSENAGSENGGNGDGVSGGSAGARGASAGNTGASGPARLGGAAAAPSDAMGPASCACPCAVGSTASTGPSGLAGPRVAPVSEAAGPPRREPVAAVNEKPVVLNRADAAELRRLPGVGAKRAEAILLLRQRLGRFRRPNELLRVKGIGRRTLERMLPHLALD